jgi:glutaminyl-tRNA synthetase
MPTLSGMRRRGYTPESIREFCNRIGVAKALGVVDLALLEHCLREHMNKHALRVMAVLRPLKVVIENYPEGKVEELEVENNPENESAGKRKIPFSRELFIEQEDFMEDPPKKFFRLGPDREVRLKGAYIIKCIGFKKDDSGNVNELRCTYDPESKSGSATAGRKVKGTLHWVSADHAKKAEVRLYDTLFTEENPANEKKFPNLTDCLNPNSLTVLKDCLVEPSLAEANPGDQFQFMRTGYFCADPVDSKPGVPVFNRSVTLRDAWAKIVKKSGGK